VSDRHVIPAFVNTGAGRADAGRAALGRAGVFDVRDTDPAVFAATIREAVARAPSRIVVAGGDGSLSAAAGAVAGTATELAVVPAGTLNHVAKDLGIPLHLDAAARVAASGRARAIDLGLVNGRVFLNTSSVGAYAAFVGARQRLERHLGYRLASLVAAARLLLRLPLTRVTVEVDGVVRTYFTPLVFIGVGERELRLPRLGARVAGGRRGMHVMVVRRRSGARTLALALEAIARGTEAVAKTPALDAFLADHCRIEAKSTRAAVDGELVDVTPPLDYSLVRDGILMVA
jgi:diacylglycerol kinase family enzyme